MKSFLGFFVLILSASFLLLACKHDPILPKNLPINLSINIPCHHDTAYFQNDVLPILQSTCAIPGCHDQQTAADGIRLNNYAQVMASGEITPGRPENSDLYKKLIDDRHDKRMPPPPFNPLPEQQIEIIRKWIVQGAQNNHCTERSGPCDSLNRSYQTHIKPLLGAYCGSCHLEINALGNVVLSTYAGAREAAESGRLAGSILHSSGYAPMPIGGSSLGDCEVQQILSWISQGMQP
ncbi:MAG: c-type cytochrome domain-containing protein [Bacteroidia bacterium]